MQEDKKQTLTNIYEINGRHVVADTIEDAIDLYSDFSEGGDIEQVTLVTRFKMAIVGKQK